MKKCLVKVLALSLIFGMWASCGFVSFAQERYHEAPMMAELVGQGKLPPVRERLPEEPLIVEPIEKTGKYGGTLRFFVIGADWPTFTRTIGYEPLVRWAWDTDFTTVLPNIAKSWEISPDGREFTFYICKGIKWSDGEPFTVDDILFWYEDILCNKELTPVFPEHLTVDDKPLVVEKVDDYTVKFKFSGPYGTFLQRSACVEMEYWAPKHYLFQFHPKYIGIDKANELARDAGYDAWYKFFAKNYSWVENPDRPVLYAWKLTSSPTAGRIVIAERNPYYWKVDPDGNQLPYIDRLSYETLTDTQVAVMKTLAGEFDLVDRMVLSPENYTLFMEERKRGNYDTRLLKPADMNAAVIQFNLNCEDPVLRAIFNDRRFRIAVSHAINREEIINLIYFGLCEPRQPAPLESSPFYDERYANAYLEYAPDEASRLLDEMGLDEKDKEGYRLRPDGKRLEITIEIAPDYRPDHVDLCELLKKYLADVGIKVESKIESAPLFFQRMSGNQHEAAIWGGDGGMEVLFEARYYIPYGDSSLWCVEWARWRKTGGKAGEEPPEEIKQMISWYDELIRAQDLEEQKLLMKKILDMHYENLYVIGVCSLPDLFSIVHYRVKNAPEWWWDSWMYPNPAPIGIYQLYIEE